MEIFVRCDGGIGRCISATGVVKEFGRRKLEEGNSVSVVTSFPYCFENIDNIERIYPIGTPFIYEDKILKGEYLEPEPYNDIAYYKDEMHLSAVFNKLLNGKCEFIKPEVILTDNEKSEGEQFITNLRKQNKKGVILLQAWSSSGGKLIAEDKGKDDESFRSFGYPFTKALVDRLEKDYTTILVKMPDQLGYKNCMTFNPPIPPRKIFSLIPYVDAVIACDSFLHHASAGLGTPVPTFVLWAGTSEKNLGYPEQTNLHSHKKTLYEPNRIPHDHAYYLQKNKGSNDFEFTMIDEIMEKITKKEHL